MSRGQYNGALIIFPFFVVAEKSRIAMTAMAGQF